MDIYSRVIVFDGGISYSVCRIAEQLPCTQIPAILSQISLDQGRQASQRLHFLHGIAETPPATRSFAAQLGKSQPRRREEFLRLTRSQHMGGSAKADLHCCNHRRGSRKGCDSATARGSRAGVYARISANQIDSKE